MPSEREKERSVMSEWKPIDTAPRDGSWILGWRDTFIQDQIEVWRLATYNKNPDMWLNAADSNDYDQQPTHWMPLPEPPKP